MLTIDSRKNNKHLPYWAFVVTSLVYVLFFFFRLPRGFDLTDSGYFLCLYRDFFTAPKAQPYFLSNLLGHTILTSFENAIIAVRIFSFLLFCLAGFFSWHSFREHHGSRNQISKYIMLSLSLMMIARFPFENIYHFATTLSASVLLFLLSRAVRAPQTKLWFFLVGNALILSVLFRVINIIFIFVCLLAILLLSKPYKLRSASSFLLGLTFGGLLAFIVLKLSNLWAGYWEMILHLFFRTSVSTASQNLYRFLIKNFKDVGIIILLLILIRVMKFLLRIIRPKLVSGLLYFLMFSIGVFFALQTLSRVGFVFLFHVSSIAFLIDQIVFPLLFSIAKKKYPNWMNKSLFRRAKQIFHVDPPNNLTVQHLESWDPSSQIILLLALSFFIIIMFGTSSSTNMSKTLWILLLPIPSLLFLPSGRNNQNDCCDRTRRKAQINRQWHFLASVSLTVIILFLSIMSTMYPYLDNRITTLTSEINHPYLQYIRTSPQKASTVTDFLDQFDQYALRNPDVVESKILTFGSIPMIEFLLDYPNLTGQYWIDLSSYPLEQFKQDLAQHPEAFLLIKEKFIPYVQNWPEMKCEDITLDAMTVEKEIYLMDEITQRGMRLIFETDYFAVYR